MLTKSIAFLFYPLFVFILFQGALFAGAADIIASYADTQKMPAIHLIKDWERIADGLNLMRMTIINSVANGHEVLTPAEKGIIRDIRTDITMRYIHMQRLVASDSFFGQEFLLYTLSEEALISAAARHELTPNSSYYSNLVKTGEKLAYSLSKEPKLNRLLQEFIFNGIIITLLYANPTTPMTVSNQTYTYSDFPKLVELNRAVAKKIGIVLGHEILPDHQKLDKQALVHQPSQKSVKSWIRLNEHISDITHLTTQAFLDDRCELLPNEKQIIHVKKNDILTHLFSTPTSLHQQMNLFLESLFSYIAVAANPNHNPQPSFNYMQAVTKNLIQTIKDTHPDLTRKDMAELNRLFNDYLSHIQVLVCFESTPIKCHCYRYNSQLFNLREKMRDIAYMIGLILSEA